MPSPTRPAPTKPSPSLSPRSRTSAILSASVDPFAPVDGASLAIFRIVFGVVLAIHAAAYLPLERIQAYYTGPAVLFHYAGFGWVEPASAGTLQLLFAGLVACGLAMAAGIAYRAAAALYLAGYLYVFLLDTARYNNHYYLILLLLALAVVVPADRVGSLRPRRPGAPPRASTVPAWALWIIRFQVAVPYTFGGIAKLNSDWLLRGEPMGLWLRNGWTEGSLDLPFFREPWAGHLFTWSGMLLDLLVVPALLWRPTRRWAFAAIAAFHLINSQLFTIGIFPWMMLGVTTIFFEPSWPRRFGLFGGAEPTGSKAGHKASRKKKTPAKERAPEASASASRPLVLAGLALWVLVQVVVPLRHFAIPGWVDWTEEGSRYAWRMKLRHKDGGVRFLVRDADSQQVTVFQNFDGVLTRFQSRMLIHDPEMIRQFARHLADRLEEQGRRGVEVRVEAPVALNGRSPQPMIDPAIDLAAEPHAIWHADWIPPLDDPDR